MTASFWQKYSCHREVSARPGGRLLPLLRSDHPKNRKAPVCRSVAKAPSGGRSGADRAASVPVRDGRHAVPDLLRDLFAGGPGAVEPTP